jgi:hypothetical protein
MRAFIGGAGFLIWVGLSGVASAQDSGQRGERRGPPPEAVEACDGKVGGEACTFTGRRGEAVEGQCFTPDEERPLACRPERPLDGPPGPPPEGERGQRSKAR